MPSDRERLDWLEQRARMAKQGRTFHESRIEMLECDASKEIALYHGFAEETLGPTLRAAIDAAMQQDTPPTNAEALDSEAHDG